MTNGYELFYLVIVLQEEIKIIYETTVNLILTSRDRLKICYPVFGLDVEKVIYK